VEVHATVVDLAICYTYMVKQQAISTYRPSCKIHITLCTHLLLNQMKMWKFIGSTYVARIIILLVSIILVLQGGKTRCTAGSVVSSLYHLKDSENRGEDAAFFVFPDLSVRMEGSYRLKLSLFEVVGCVWRCDIHI
jgi:Velvet factor